MPRKSGIVLLKGTSKSCPIPPLRDRVNPVAAVLLALHDWRDPGFFEVPLIR
jgi:hypothetical protein